MEEKEVLFQKIGDKVHKIREQYVLLDRDIIKLYGLEYKYFHSVVAKRIERLENGESDDIMFQLTQAEYSEILTSQTAILEKAMYSNVLPYVFTKIGLSALSKDFNSERAIKACFQIFRYVLSIEKSGLELNSEDLKRYAKEYQLK